MTLKVSPVKNSGLIIEKPNEKDWVLGGISGATSPILFPDGHGWLKFQRPEETQKNRNFDTFSCVSYACLKSLSYYMKVAYGLDMDFSERFTAVMSGTIPNRGNSIRNVLESIRKHGFVLESDYPSLTDDMTQNEWFAYPSASVRNIGLKNLERWLIEWEILSYLDPVPHSQIIEGQKKGVPIITVFAWASYFGDEESRVGVYYDYDNQANHATTGPEHEDSDPIVDIVADDSYPAGFDEEDRPNSEYIKRLAKTFKIHSAHVITAQPKPLDISLIGKLKNMFVKIKRDIHGGIWFIKNACKQKIESWLDFSGAVIDEVGCGQISDADLAKYKDYKFFGK